MAYTLFVVLIVLVSILMVLIVLIQESKGGGLASNFSSTNSIMGVRKTTDIVEKITWGLVAFVGIGAIIINIFTLNPAKESVDFTEQITTEVETPDFSTTMPEAEAPATEVPAEEAPAAQQN